MGDTAVSTSGAMQRIGRYPEYRDGGVEWLGEIPAHWEVGRLKKTVSECRNGVWGEDPHGTDDVACIRVADFDRDTFSVNLSSLTLRHLDPRALSTHRLRQGDLLLEKSGGGERQPVGAVVIFADDLPAVCSNFIARMPVNDGNSPVFLVYLHAVLYSSRINVRSIKQSIGIQNLDSESYLNELVGLPPFEEQHEIAEFLHRETAKLDELVAKQQELIRLLQEKRTALISHAVTKGLDPDVAMKDSGVEWLGEIPAHWPVQPLKTLSAMRSGDSITADSIESTGRYPVFGGNGLRGYTGDFTHEGDHILIGRQGAHCGNVHLGRGRFWASEHAVVVTLESPHLIEWCGALLEAMDLNRLSVAAAQPGLAVERLRNSRVPVPPVVEQRDIVRFLDRETATIAELASKANDAITLLNEYRTALISAAVTGKIDVRHALEPTPNPATHHPTP